MTKRPGTRMPGWAILHDGKLDIRTATAERRGAIINWLVVERGGLIRDSDSDAAIEALWQLLKGEAEAVEIWIMVRRKDNGEEANGEAGSG